MDESLAIPTNPPTNPPEVITTFPTVTFSISV